MTVLEITLWGGLGATALLGAGFWIRHVRGTRKLSRALGGTEVPRALLFSGPRSLETLVKPINRVLEDYHTIHAEVQIRERARREFLSGISHDLRTPLTSLIGYLRALGDEAQATGTVNAEYLAILTAKAAQLKDRIEKFFDFAKLESGEWTVQPESLDAAEVVRQVLIDALPLLEGIETTLSLPPREVWFDRLALMRIVQNLVQNAFTHAAAGAWLGVTLTEEPPIRLVVEDAGPGIPDDLKPFLFERRRKGSRSSGGLGLAIAAELARLHGATLEVEARQPQGTRFTLTLK